MITPEPRDCSRPPPGGGNGSSPPPSGWLRLGRPLRRRGVVLDVDSELMFTTDGSSCLATCLNVLLSCCGDCMGSRVASAVGDELPRTPLLLTTVPIRMPTVRVTRIIRLKSHRWDLIRATKAAKREFITLTFLRAFAPKTIINPAVVGVNSQAWWEAPLG